MEAMIFVVGVASVGLLFDVVCSCMAAVEWKREWAGFRVLKNGAVYNVEAKRFATKAEKAKLACFVDLF